MTSEMLAKISEYSQDPIIGFHLDPAIPIEPDTCYVDWVNKAYTNLFGSVEGLDKRSLNTAFWNCARMQHAVVKAIRSLSDDWRFTSFDIRNENLGRWFNVKVISLGDHYVACVLNDMTATILEKEQIAFEASTDALTQIPNRTKLYAEIDRIMAEADETHMPVSAAMFDLDFFKDVNDAFGHPAGDLVLKNTATLCRDIIRPSDTIYRLGGEEFLIIMPQTDIEGAHSATRKLRIAIAEYRHDQVGIVTASFGIAERRPKETFASWYKRTDNAVYEAKRIGRNCVVRDSEIETRPIISIGLAWRVEWESGFPAIDFQHHSIHKLGVRLMELAIGDTPLATLLTEIDFMQKAILDHFVFEESILESVRFEHLDTHRLIHQKLLNKGKMLKRAFSEGNVNPSLVYSFIVNDLIVGHIIDEDTKFFPYLKHYKKGE